MKQNRNNNNEKKIGSERKQCAREIHPLTLMVNNFVFIVCLSTRQSRKNENKKTSYIGGGGGDGDAGNGSCNATINDTRK